MAIADGENPLAEQPTAKQATTEQATAKQPTVVQAKDEDQKFRIGIAVFVGVLVIGTIFIAYFGIQPRVVDMIRLSKFETPRVLSNSVMISLGQDLQSNSVVVIGIDSSVQDASDFLKDFFALQVEARNQTGEKDLNDSNQPGFRVLWDTILGDPVIAEPTQKLDFSQSQQIILNEVRDSLAQNTQGKQHLFLITNSYHSSHLIEKSMINLIETDLKAKLFALTVTNFPRRREDERTMKMPCNVGPKDEYGIGDLGCVVLRYARNLYKKKMDPGSLVGFFIKTGATDTVLALARQP